MHNSVAIRQLLIPKNIALLPTLVLSGLTLLGSPITDDPFSFSTGSPDGKIGTASHPSGPGKIEVESADDFILGNSTLIDHATITGLLPAGVSLKDIEGVAVELYRVFPADSDAARTPNVITRVNSPADNAFDSRDSADKNLQFRSDVLQDNFSVLNTVVNGIHPLPNQFTGGEGAASGQQVLISITFKTPFELSAGHYFFKPSVDVTGADFLWLSAPKPTTPPFAGDLQTWIRDENLAPDWERIGTDVTHAGPFNATFSLSGTELPDSTNSFLLMGLGLAGLLAYRGQSRKQPHSSRA